MGIDAGGDAESTNIIRCGTRQAPSIPARLAAGPLSVEVLDGVATSLSWYGTEVLRAIDCPVRDQNWATCASETVAQNTVSSSDRFELTHQRHVAGRSLDCRLIFSGTSDGCFRAAVEIFARVEFITNRAGFILLHPLEGLTGSIVGITHDDGSVETGTFPTLISPSQVAYRIAGLDYVLCGVQVKIRFKGETFEMEDQRNWSDASFKTYCRPLARPFPYRIGAGETVGQEIEIRMVGPPQSNGVSAAPRNAGCSFAVTGERVPSTALVLDAMSLPNLGEMRMVRRVKPSMLQLRLEPDTVDSIIGAAAELCRDFDVCVALEVVVPEDRQIDGYLAEVAESCRRSSIKVSGVLALPAAYLRSYQPDGRWPEGLTPNEACIAARKAFPAAEIGGGMLTHFVELNRCQPSLSVCDYLSHGSTAILHAADDRSVIQSLKGLSHIFGSVRALANGHAYRLGLVSIGMRSNPHGVDVAPNPEQIRIPMARIDPRQRGTFAAAWAVGAFAMTAGHNVSSMALAAPVGPFGLLYRRACWPQPIFDELTDAVVYPLFHVVRALSRMAGCARILHRAASCGIVSVAADMGSGWELVAANLSEETGYLEFPRKVRTRRLDRESFHRAIKDPDWLSGNDYSWEREVALAAFDVAFVDVAEPLI